MSANQDRVSVNYQGTAYDQRVVYKGDEYLASRNAAGVYHLIDEVDGQKLLDYCSRCSDASSDGCLGVQLMAEQSFFKLKSEHFVNQSS